MNFRREQCDTSGRIQSKFILFVHDTEFREPFVHVPLSGKQRKIENSGFLLPSAMITHT